MVIAYEWPVPLPWFPKSLSLTKRELEQLHLDRFSGDHTLATGRPAFDEAAAGRDPPDAIVITDHGQLGVDCTALAVQDRRHVHALFARLRNRLMELPRKRVAHLAGLAVYIWFAYGESESARPFRRKHAAAIQEMINALLDYRPDPDRLLLVGDKGLPEQAPDLGITHTSSGASFYAVPLTNAVPVTSLFSSAGFEIGLAYTTVHYASSGWLEIQRRIRDHDKPGIDWLLISVGAPDLRGVIHPSEEAFARFLISNPRPLTTPQHIHRVTMHLWSTGEGFELLPRLTELFGPLYQGMVVVHQPILKQNRHRTPESDEKARFGE